jgi:hypothetical protein
MFADTLPGGELLLGLLCGVDSSRLIGLAGLHWMMLHVTGGRGNAGVGEGCNQRVKSFGMSHSVLFGWMFRIVRGRERGRKLQAAAGWPVAQAKLLASKLVMKDDLAGGLDVQDTQVEVPYYFSIGDGFFGGFVRSVPCTDSEGRRIQRSLEEGMPVNVRYDPGNPDVGCVLATDNEGALPFVVWPG